MAGHENIDQAQPARPGAVGQDPLTQVDDAFSAAFDGDATRGIEPYVRLVPPSDDEVATGAPTSQDGVAPGRSSHAMFDPGDIERREYRLLSRALTNGDDATENLGAMTLVQLVKFLRAAGVSVPYFPETPNAPDPRATLQAGPGGQGVDSGPM